MSSEKYEKFWAIVFEGCFGIKFYPIGGFSFPAFCLEYGKGIGIVSVSNSADVLIICMWLQVELLTIK